MKANREEALRWLRQAENDHKYAALGLKEGFYAQVCFQCQQICEKALKSIHYGALKKRVVFGHSLVELSRELDFDKDLIKDLSVIDQYYIPTRYPNGLPGAVPYEVYTEDQARHAFHVCEMILDYSKKKLPD